MKILVLAGGISREREVSLASGKAIADALKSLGNEVKMVDTVDGKDLLTADAVGAIKHIGETRLSQQGVIQSKASAIATYVPADFRDCDCVFIALHGGIGENGTLQALLDLAGVNYTGSGVLASALAMDKHRAKLLFDSVGIPLPTTIFCGDEAPARIFCSSQACKKLRYPVVVKPNAEGSTIGLTVAEDYDTLLKGVKNALEFGREILIEEYIPGRELTVAILGEEPLPLIEIVPRSGLYDYTAKYTAGESNYICPAVIDAEVDSKVKEFARRAYEVLGCSGYARVDFRLNPENELFCLEVNTLPGMTATSLVPKAAKAAGLSFERLLERIIALSFQKVR